MDITKVLEILSKHIIHLEEVIYKRESEISELNERLEKVKEHIESYYERN